MLGALLTGLPIPAHAAATPSPSPTVSAQPSLHASPSASGVLRSADVLRVTVRVDNPTNQALPATEATLGLGPQPLRTADEILDWLDGSTTPELTQVATSVLTTVPAQGSLEGALAVQPTAAALKSRAPGVYPFEVTYSTADGELTSTGVITVLGKTAPTVSVVVPVTAGPTADGMISADRLAQLTAPDGALTALLAGISSPEVVLAIDPAIVATVRALGRTAPTSATDWLTRLENMPNPRVALQYGDADVALQFAAGLTSPLKPTNLTAYVDLTDSGENNATPDPTDTGPGVAPTTEQLLDIGSTIGEIWWPSTVTAAVMDASANATVMIPSAQVGTTAAHVSVSGRTALVYDRRLGDVLAEAVGETDSAVRGRSLATASALLSLDTATASGHPVLVAMSRTTTVDESALSATLATVTTIPGATTVSGGDLLTGEPVTATLSAASVDQNRVPLVEQMLDDADAVSRFARLLVEPDLLTGRERAREQQLLAVGWRDETAWATAMDAQHARAIDLRNSIRIVQPPKVTLVSQGSKIPVFVRNDLPFPAQVDVVAQPLDLRVRVEPVTSVRAAADANTSVPIPVTAGVSNGDVEISMQMRASDGTMLGAVQYAELSVRADWERIGLIVIGTLAVLFIGIGLFRTIRRRRRGDESRPSRRQSRADYRTTTPAEDAEKETHG